MTLIPQAGCSFTDLNCICTNQMLQDQATVCLANECTVKQALATKQYQDNMCGVPVRDQSALSRKINWPLFGIAFVAVVFRFLARSSRLDGPGFGWDDWTTLVSFGLLVAANALLDTMTRLGLGHDIWQLKSGQITDILYVRCNNLVYTARH